MVCGLLFNPAKSTVVLIEKDHPDWMAGKLNGVGGKAHADETFQQAMEREFAEEAGPEIQSWQSFAVKVSPRRDNPNELVRVEFFRAFDMVMYRTVTREREKIVRLDLTDMPYANMVDHLEWLILLALDERIAVPVYFSES